MQPDQHGALANVAPAEQDASQAQHADAAQLLQRALPEVHNVPGLDSAPTLLSAASLARRLCHAGQLEEAATLLEQALAPLRSTLEAYFLPPSFTLPDCREGGLEQANAANAVGTQRQPQVSTAP